MSRRGAPHWPKRATGAHFGGPVAVRWDGISMWLLSADLSAIGKRWVLFSVTWLSLDRRWGWHQKGCGRVCGAYFEGSVASSCGQQW